MTSHLADRYALRAQVLRAKKGTLIGGQFFLSFKSLCPSAWVQRWDDQRGEWELYYKETQ
jgi:hypothetical protein